MGICLEEISAKLNDTLVTTKFLEKHQNRTPIDRPTWAETYLNIAKEISLRSCDGQNKHGCVITDLRNTPIGMGFNSFARGMPDDIMPNLRPDKYPLIIHAERNALDNCIISPVMLEGINVYTTGIPCLDCLNNLVNNRCKNIWFIKGGGWSDPAKIEEESVDFNFLIKKSKINLYSVEFDMV